MEISKFLFYEKNQLIRKISFTGEKQIIISIGSLNTDVVYTTDGVSRLHAQLIFDGQNVFMQDCSSTNGTFVNDKKIISNKPIILNPDDIVKFSLSASAELRVEGKNSSAKPSLKDSPDKSIIQYFNNKQEVSIGRSNDCDIVINHPSISRLHARIKKTSDGKYKISDQGSLNGTFVNGKRVQSATVSSNDKIYVGRFLLSLNGEAKNLSLESAIKADSISKVYKNGFAALKNTTFDIASGGLIAIMGPSGCGKSTLLKVLNGDSPSSSGHVYINGLELNSNYDYLKTQIGYVPQEDIVHRELTVEQSLYYSAKIRLEGISDEAAYEKIESILKELNIVDIRNNLVSAISGGQRKRVSIAVELLPDPAILFLDEPTSPLDPQTIEEFMSILRNLSKKGTTVVMVTHKPDDLKHMDSVIFMAEGGNLVYFGPVSGYQVFFAVGSPLEVYSKISGSNAQDWIGKSYKSNSNLLSSGNFNRREKPDVNALVQYLWLLRRYFKIKTNDKVNSIIMILQAPIIAMLICIIFPDIRLAVPFLMAISSVWFGVNNAAREIVSEAPIYKRERMFNVLIFPYIFSKITVLGVFAFVQAVLFNLIIGINYSGNLHWNDPVLGTVWMFFLTVSSSLLGLFISSVFSTSEKVMSIVPIVVIPQIMLAGIVANIQNGGVEFISYFTFSRWGTEGFSLIQKNVIDKVPLVNTDPSSGKVIGIIYDNKSIGAYELLKGNFYSSYNSTFGDSAGTLRLDFIMVSFLTIFFLFGVWVSLKKKDSI